MDMLLILNAQLHNHPYQVSASIQALAESPRRADWLNADFTDMDDAANQNRGTKINKWQSHAGGYPRG